MQQIDLLIVETFRMANPSDGNIVRPEKSEPKDDALRKHVDEEVARFYKMVPQQQDPILTILRGHLLCEYYLERISILCLRRGDRLVNDGRLSFSQKLALVEALDVLPDSAIQTLKQLNGVRNACAHEMDREITLADVERIGRPLGRVFTALRREHMPDISALLTATLSELCTHLTFVIWTEESRAAKEVQKHHVSK